MCRNVLVGVLLLSVSCIQGIANERLPPSQTEPEAAATGPTNGSGSAPDIQPAKDAGSASAPASDDTPREDEPPPGEPEPEPEPEPAPEPEPQLPPDSGLAEPEPEPALVRVATLNLLGLHSSQAAERLEIVADALEELDADLIALQEVGENPLHENTAAQLAASLGYHWTWTVTLDAGVYKEGPGLLSRWPFDEEVSVELPHGDFVGTVERAVIAVQVDAQGTPFCLGATHLIVSGLESQSLDQARAAHDVVVDLASAASGCEHYALAGDLNAEPETPSMQWLRGDLDEGAPSVLEDAWLQAGAGSGETFPAEGPERRIDYIYKGGGTAVVDCWQFLTEPTDGLFASDHVGVVCDFSL